MPRLKADFHCHCADDPLDGLRYSAEELIDGAAAAAVDVLAITLHEFFLDSPRLRAYAAERGVLLMPGVECTIEGKHVVILNPDKEQASIRTFAELRRIGRREGAVLAPHPFYPIPASLGSKYLRHRDLFDCIEYSSLYLAGINPNWFARWASRRYGIPLLGNSDAHELPYPSNTFTWIEADKTVPSIIEAIRAGRVTVETRPRCAVEFTRNAYFAIRGYMETMMQPAH
jgi:predicted metal-dependent phosphoesterase TrpH